ncbi:Outer membrane protein TolC [Pseudarcicella hirudinis]|uniref:Outer membrane protein TolC n=1 Tax=Pseudarcicella hirudinis TaxID=1079859 RepID=A0A1I5RDJ3_9BACT|nr:TolC family protein [Pseudarcicella hirudinis]SFP56582.1 Outer membrane protein TolC [Pseudarcicella hirudinis]
MKTNKLFILFSLLAVQQGFAQGKTDEALNQLIRSAIEYSPKIKEQQQTILIGDYKTRIHQANEKPNIAGEVGVTRFDPVAKATLGGTTIQFQPNMNYNANVGANYTVYDWGKNALEVEKSKLETELSKTNVEGLKNIYAYQVANLYYGIVYLQKAIEVQKQQLKLVNDNEKIISDRLKQGDALDYDQISVQVRYKNAESRLADLQSQLERQYIYLNSLVGKDIRGSITAQTTFDLGLPELTVDNAYNDAQTSNFDLKTLKEKDLIYERDVKLSQMSLAPSLVANGSVGIKNGYFPRINGEIPSFSDDFKLNSVLGIKLNIPIYSGKKGAYNTSIAKLNREMLKYSVDVTNQALRRDLEQAQNDLKTAQEKMDLSEKTVFQADYALKLAESRFKNGVITNVEIESAQTALKEAQLTQLQYQYQIVLAKLEINRLTGVKFW